MPVTLFMSARSPFARRIRIALARLQIPFEPKVINVFDPPKEFLDAAPIGLVPVLRTESGVEIPDSSGILEYLDETARETTGRARIWPSDPALRLRVRIASTWSEGIMTATVAHFLESERKAPQAGPDASVLAEHRENIERTLRALHSKAGEKDLWAGPSQAAIDLVIALEYLDLRIPELKWREKAPELIPILEGLAEQAPFKDTRPPPA